MCRGLVEPPVSQPRREPRLVTGAVRPHDHRPAQALPLPLAPRWGAAVGRFLVTSSALTVRPAVEKQQTGKTVEAEAADRAGLAGRGCRAVRVARPRWRR